jgi:hypothetical protein
MEMWVIDRLIGLDKSFIAVHCDAGFPFSIACFESASGKLLWRSDVWGAGRTMLMGVGFHNVTLQREDDLIIVFGGESHGMYIEAFDIETGENAIRFYTSYWFHFSEEWGLG